LITDYENQDFSSKIAVHLKKNQEWLRCMRGAPVNGNPDFTRPN
jgi:hypothetical protein